MVDIKKDKNGHDYDVFTITQDEGSFEISFQNNLDLYWRYIPTSYEEEGKKEFTITKENYELYSMFDRLYGKVETGKLFEADEEYSNYLKETEQYNKNRLMQDGVIKWYSDDSPLEEASSMTIEKADEEFKLTFEKSKDLSLFPPTYAVRISNSGSKYEPYNVAFMQMYQELKDYNPEYHQIHLEEVMYAQRMTLKKTSK